MDKNELIEYLRIIKDTEIEIYTSKQLIDNMPNLVDILKRNKPVEPIKPTTHENEKINVFVNLSTEGKILLILGIILSIILMFIGAITAYHSANLTLIICYVISFLILGLCIFYIIKVRIGIQSQRKLEYQKELEKYNCDLKEYDLKIEEYNNKFNEYKLKDDEFLKAFNEKISQMNIYLHKLYDLNIIYSKYRDFVSVCSFLEYLESGRTDSLDGTSGAYNIYESEKRQNMIIFEINKAIDNLDTIKNNQYELYVSLINANNKVTSILSNIENNQGIMLYENEFNTQMIVASNFLERHKS